MAERFADLASGDAVTVLEVPIDREALVRYAGAADDYVRQHWDQGYMADSGYPDVVVHGWLTAAHLCRMVTAWAPAEATIAAYAVRYRHPLYPGHLRCGGTVEAADHAKVHLRLWADDLAGETVATAIVTLRRADHLDTVT